MITVGVLDTGVDPLAPGLQTTSDGKPKLIDVIDCTGSGDVTMAEELEATDGVLSCADGTKLTISAEWKNPSGKWRVGFKSSADLYPRPLTKRMDATRREKFDAKHSELVARV